MYKINLSPDELLELKKLKSKYQSNRKILRRLRIIELRNNWFKMKQIVYQLELSEDTITRQIKLFKNYKFDWIINTKYDWRRISEFEKCHSEIIKEVNDNFHTYKSLHNNIKSKFSSIQSWIDWLYKYCKKKQISFSKKQN